MRGRLFTRFLPFAQYFLRRRGPRRFLTEQRRLYDQAKAALAKGNSAPYMASRSALRDYPLEPYLAYDELTHRLKTASNEEVERFPHRTRRPAADRLAETALAAPAGRPRRLEDLRHYYDPKLNFTELDCLYGRYQLGHGQKAEGYATSERLWLVGSRSRLPAIPCSASGGAKASSPRKRSETPSRLAAEARNYSLASHLAQRLPTLGNQGRADGQRWRRTPPS